MNKSWTPRILFSIRLTEILHITLIMFAILGSHGRAKWILVSTFLLRCTISYMENGITHRVLFLLHVVPCCLPQFFFSSQISIVLKGLIAVKSEEKLEQVSLKPVAPLNTPPSPPTLISPAHGLGFFFPSFRSLYNSASLAGAFLFPVGLWKVTLSLVS